MNYKEEIIKAFKAGFEEGREEESDRDWGRDHRTFDEALAEYLKTVEQFVNDYAKLAAAPELLEALDLAQAELRAAYKRLGYIDSNVLRMVDNAIKKPTE